MANDTAQDQAIYQALMAADEAAAALQAHLVEEHGADPDRAADQDSSTNSLKLLRQARERPRRGAARRRGPGHRGVRRHLAAEQLTPLKTPEAALTDAGKGGLRAAALRPRPAPARWRAPGPARAPPGRR